MPRSRLKLDGRDCKLELNNKRSGRRIAKFATSSDRFRSIPVTMANTMKHTELTFLSCLKHHHKEKEENGKKCEGGRSGVSVLKLCVLDVVCVGGNSSIYHVNAVVRVSKCS